MLGRLSRFMRIMGYDTMYPNLEVADSEIIEMCRNESRILVSRDRQICLRYKDSIRINSDIIQDQIVPICSYEKPTKEKLVTRCTACNGVLIPGNCNCKEEFDPRKADKVSHCPDCGKCYWPGTHSEGIVKFLSDLGIFNQ